MLVAFYQLRLASKSKRTTTVITTFCFEDPLAHVSPAVAATILPIARFGTIYVSTKVKYDPHLGAFIEV